MAFSSLTLASLAGLLLLPAIPQDQDYHQFADQRTIFGIPNFWNVVSNVPFLVVGAAGLRRFHRDAATVVFFLGVFLTGIGSSYYHWNPHDGTLFWDRLPMTFSFAALLALIVSERVSEPAGAVLLWPALATGVFSLLLWLWTDDLRLYFWVQFFPALAAALLFSLYPAKYTGSYYWIVALVIYALAKLSNSLRGNLFGRKHRKQAHLEASCGRGGVLCNTPIFPFRQPVGGAIQQKRLRHECV